jgi:two-component system, LytTR family, response regulator LytT
MKILIVEDEPLIAKRLIRLVQNYFSTRLSLLEQLDEVDEALQYVQDTPVDLLLLDLNLYGQDGFEILRRACAEACHCIIVSAYADKAIQAFEYGVLDFVAKPFTEERLHKALLRFDQQQHNVRETQQLAIKKIGRIQLLAIADIDYLKADGHYTQIYMSDGSVHLHEKSFERLLMLLPDFFMRIHRSYAVNLGNVKAIHIGSGGKYSVDTGAHKNVSLSRTYYLGLKQRLAY